MMHQVMGIEACCVNARVGEGYELGGCSFANRLEGRCCDQLPCRDGARDVEISADGQKIVFTADVNYAGTGTLHSATHATQSPTRRVCTGISIRTGTRPTERSPQWTPS